MSRWAARAQPVPAVDGPGSVRPGQAASPPAGLEPGVGPLTPSQRGSVARKRNVVLHLLRGASAELLSREAGLPMFKLEQWRHKAETALEGALEEREADTACTELAAAMQRVSALSMENELLRARVDEPGPLAWRRSR
jgi:hypothetical protein